MPRDLQTAKELAQSCVERLQQAGADAADAVLFSSEDISLRYRLGKVESIERSESTDLGLRALVQGKGGMQQAIVSTNDMSDDALASLFDKVVAMAKAAPSDPHIALAEAGDAAPLELDIHDTTNVTPEQLEQWASDAESAALGIAGVTNADTTEASSGSGVSVLATSNGFVGGYASSLASISTSVIAGEGTKMETDHAYSVARHIADLDDAASIGKEAGERAVKRLNPRKVPSAQVPIIFEPRTARSLLGHFASAINGAAIARGTSFLKDKMGEKIFADGIQIIDDPHRKRGLASEPFDGEGVQGKALNLVEDGVLQSWILDTRSANQLGLTTTGHASRGTSGPPSPSSSNMHLAAGTATPEELMTDIQSGFYITDLFGMGVNGVTGDYSRGASGFWIENGQIAYPVSEVTIAGNLLDMFARAIPANDLTLRRAMNSPSLRIDGLTVAGV